MVIILHNEQGFVQTAITHSDMGLVEMSQKYADSNILHILLEEHDDIDLMNCYVINPLDLETKQVINRPYIEVHGLEDRPLKSDGMDTMKITTMPVCNLKVLFGQLEVANIQTDEPVEIVSDQQGVFTLLFEAEFPYQIRRVTIEAVK